MRTRGMVPTEPLSTETSTAPALGGRITAEGQPAGQHRRPFNRKTSQQTEEIAKRNVNQDLNRLRQPNLLPFSACSRCYLVNLGLVSVRKEVDSLESFVILLWPPIRF